MKHDKFEILKVTYSEGACVEIYYDDRMLVELNETDQGEAGASFIEKMEMNREDFKKFLQLVDEGMTWLRWSKEEAH